MSTITVMEAAAATSNFDRSTPRVDMEHVERLADDTVLIAGAGPVGLVLATTLAHYGIKSVLLERNLDTTRWPKMDLTNGRSMEMFRRLGLADSLRERGVPSSIPYTVLISSGLTAESALTKWELSSVDEYRELISNQNDGTLPLEPYQRLSQELFEAWLRRICDENPLIDLRFGWKVTTSAENQNGVRLNAVDVKNAKGLGFESKYLVGCDGASSKVRRDMSVGLDGGPIPSYALLVHFKSRDLTRLHRQGQFWHIFFPCSTGLSGAIIAQDEVDTWTTHMFLPMDVDSSSIESADAVYAVLGGMGQKYEITIDEILVRSTYRPSIAVAEKYQGPLGQVYLAGDAAHQNIPTGGYGMNMGLGDAFDLGWKLAARMKGYGGPALLESYEQDRRPVAQLCCARSGAHMNVHMDLHKTVELDASLIDDNSGEAQNRRQQIHDYYQRHDGENRDLGVEMGQRYKSAIIMADQNGEEPLWLPSRYIPSTWPGSRAPHVFLRDGSAIFDHYGKYFTVVEFSDGAERGTDMLGEAAEKLGVPLKALVLEGEDHAYRIWDTRLAIIRPDGHVSWRGESVQSLDTAMEIVSIVAGYGRPSSVHC